MPEETRLDNSYNIAVARILEIVVYSSSVKRNSVTAVSTISMHSMAVFIANLVFWLKEGVIICGRVR